MLGEYFDLILFLLFLFIVVFSISLLSLSLNVRSSEPEKLSAYECGFNPFESSRQKFEIHFYLVAMLFILFDVEVALLLPFTFIFSIVNLFGFVICISFLLILTIGFIYEWVNQALTWY